jgi:hypothetical protein
MSAGFGFGFGFGFDLAVGFCLLAAFAVSVLTIVA